VHAPEPGKRGRGRPARQDAYPVDTLGRPTAQAKAAWLLRVTRLHGSRPYRNLTTFAHALNEAGIERAGPSTISRIETGAIAPTFETARGYERVLGLPSFSLASVLDTIFRYRASAFDAKPLLRRRGRDARDVYRRFDELVERACSRDVMTGADWDELTVIVADRPDLVVSPRSAWLSLTNRLLAEMMIADGVPWMQRSEALNRLLAHPMVGIDALGILCAAVDDRGIQSMVGTASMFDASAEPQAAAEVLRHMREPPDDRVFKGTLMACVRKLRYSQFTGPQITRLSGLVAGALQEQDHLDEGTCALAVSVLCQLPRQAHGDLGRRTLQRQALERSPASVLAENRLLGWASGRLIAERIAHHASARTVTVPDTYTDKILPLIIDEMLSEPVYDARLYAALLINASPYGAATAEALVTEIASAYRNRNLAWVIAIFEALRNLGGQAERHVVEHFVTDAGVSEAVADAAAYALGHISGASGDEFWQRALICRRLAWKRSASAVSGSILDRLVYAIGMSGNAPLLRAVQGDGDMPPRVRACAGWWLSRPDFIRQSSAS
jgi:hypothetical protein